MKQNPNNFRVFGPDENSLEPARRHLRGQQEALAGRLPARRRRRRRARTRRPRHGDALRAHARRLARGYLLTGRHGFFSTYEAFVHVIDSMFNMHAKWLAICRELPWRAPVSSLNLLITSTVWRQDHNGFTHQDPASSTSCSTRARTSAASTSRPTSTRCCASPTTACAARTTSTSSSATSRSTCST